MIFWLCIVSLTVLSKFTLIPYGTNPVHAYHSTKGKVTSYLFSMNTTVEIKKLAYFQVTFPVEFLIPGFGLNIKCKKY